METQAQKIEKVLEDDPQLTTKEAAEASGLQANHFIFQINQGNIKGSKDERGRWLIRNSELNRYLQTKTVKPKRQYNKAPNKDIAETSLLTQLTEQTKENEILSAELGASRRLVDDLEASHERVCKDYEAQIADNVRRLEARKNTIERQKAEIESLKIENNGHTEFLRTTLSDLLKYVTK